MEKTKKIIKEYINSETAIVLAEISADKSYEVIIISMADKGVSGWIKTDTDYTAGIIFDNFVELVANDEDEDYENYLQEKKLKQKVLIKEVAKTCKVKDCCKAGDNLYKSKLCQNTIDKLAERERS